MPINLILEWPSNVKFNIFLFADIKNLDGIVEILELVDMITKVTNPSERGSNHFINPKFRIPAFVKYHI